MYGPNPLLHDGDNPIDPMDALDRISYILRALGDLPLLDTADEIEISKESKEGQHMVMNFMADIVDQVVESSLEKRKAEDGWQRAEKMKGRGMKANEKINQGVDVTLIRWMLSLTPTERLQALQQNVRSILKLRNAKTHK